MLDGIARATTNNTIHFQFVQGINPVGIYCLLPNKSRTTYDRFINQILELIPSASPTKIITDFEIAANKP